MQECLTARILGQQLPGINDANIRAPGEIGRKITTVTTSPRIRQKVVKDKRSANNRIRADGNHGIHHLRYALSIVRAGSDGPRSQGETGATRKNAFIRFPKFAGRFATRTGALDVFFCRPSTSCHARRTAIFVSDGPNCNTTMSGWWGNTFSSKRSTAAGA